MAQKPKQNELRIIAKPKRTRQGNGKHSKISHGRKLRRGQGK